MITMRSLLNKALIAAVSLAFVCAAPARAQQGVSAQQVRASIDDGLRYLRAAQQKDGSWSGTGYPGGVTALCLLAMLNAGIEADDAQIQSGLDRLLTVRDSHTYVVALKCQVLAAVIEQTTDAAEKAKLMRQLAAGAAWLIKAQTNQGIWTYTMTDARSGRGDNSNTQFALLGLHEAAKAGVTVPAEVWNRSRKHYENTQNRDGSWGYVGRQRGYGSMTAAGLASLSISGTQLHTSGRKVFVNGVYPGCGAYQQSRTIAAGLDWLADNFAVDQNPGHGRRWVNYYLYTIERAGMIVGLPTIGRHDWYRRGAEHLVSQQRSPGGNWGSNIDTALALLFLAKGNRPVLIQKLRWDGRWNRNIHDLENLTAFMGDSLGKRVSWQNASLDQSVQQLRQAPILYITGHEAPKFDAAGKRKLREFVESGGTLLADACCGSDAFEKGFRELCAELFPEYRRLGPLPESHGVFGSLHKLEDTYGLEGIQVGCRTAVFFSPNALSPLWEMQDYKDARRDWSLEALKLGANIAAYATGRQTLPDRLDVVELAERARPLDAAVEVPRGAVRIARLEHTGDYQADPHAMVTLAAMLRRDADVDVVSREKAVAPTDESLYEYPVLYMTGHYGFEYSDKQVEALKKYLSRGGVLVADACCGKEAFDESFRKLVVRLFGEKSLKPLAKDHPVLTGRVGKKLGQLQYRPLLAEELKAKRGPAVLEAVVLDGRTAIFYSKYDFGCALEGDGSYACRGYGDEDGKTLAFNIFLYAIGF
jgi:hypothetical protein